MNIADIIDKKRLNKKLTKEEIFFTIEEYMKEKISDAQMSSLLMAICINGMDYEETSYLTEAMIESGDKIDLSVIPGIEVDKHSTGGVGDKTTLVLISLVASCGVKVAKMSGRALGFTGGTIDKLESIPGFDTSLMEEQFINNCLEIGVALTSQTANLAPADKKIYALRSVTGTVESIPLVASSIMSKKIASGAEKIVIDLKVGDGALMKNMDEAHELANFMVNIGKSHGKETICVITDMSQNLGHAIGNSLEVLEAMQVLRGKGPEDVRELVIELGTQMVHLATGMTIDAANNLVIENLNNGKAYAKFLEFVQKQEGDITKIDYSSKCLNVLSTVDGYVKDINTDDLGRLIIKLGGGRVEKDDAINHEVGLIVRKKVSDKITKEEVLVSVYYDDVEITEEEVRNCFEFSDNPVEKPQLILEIVK